MTESTQLPTGVVLDEPLGRALLYAATHEGLVDDDETIGDGFVRQLMSQKPSDDTLAAAFEQLAVGGKVFLSSAFHPVGWNGQIFERGIVDLIGEPEPDKLIEFSDIDTDVMLGMLHVRGIQWSVNEFAARCQAYLDALSEWKAVAEGKSFDALETLVPLSNVNSKFLDDYSPRQVEQFHKVKREERGLKPMFNCIKDYCRVVTVSLDLGALSSLPIQNAALKSLPFAAAKDGTETYGLFKITCQRLRRMPVGATLSETIEMAMSPEATALRVKLAEWTEKLRGGNIHAAELVIEEVEKARASLLGAKRLAKNGRILTYLGLPIGIAADLLSLFASGGLGIATGLGASAAGTMLLIRQSQIENSNKWAMYGQI